MRKHLRQKPLGKQVMVITGATSGIGLSTARAAAAKGARLMLAARNEDALKAVRDDLTGKGAHVAYVVADVGVDVSRGADRVGGPNRPLALVDHQIAVVLQDQRASALAPG